MNSLDLALVGNGTIGALIDATATVVWGCFPRLDGDPVFCSLVNGATDQGLFAIELSDCEGIDQAYIENTAVLVTRMHDRTGGAVEIIDFAPLFAQHGRTFRPMTLIRQLRRIRGSPRLTLRMRPLCASGADKPSVTWGSNHIRYAGPGLALRLTTDTSVTSILQETPFFLEDTATLFLGADETLQGSTGEVGRRFLEETTQYWREWVRALAVPFEWQEAVIRAAITLKLNAFDDTGAVIAAVTTSVPEAAESGRNWDYRHCWLRDGYFVVNALNRLGDTRTMERYLGYIINVAADADGRPLQPVYGIDGRMELPEHELPALSGYRDMGPVRSGNLAYRQVQHDVYGSTILAAAHVFFDQRLTRRGDKALFRRLEPLGERAYQCHDQPDAGLWELRGSARVHTFSAVMCWAAADRLSRIAIRLGLDERAAHWRERATRMHATISSRSWSRRRKTFTSTFDGNAMDASLLLLAEVGFLEAADPRFAATVRAVERELMHRNFVFRYVEEDDFGEPRNAFLVCTFWYVNALAAIGKHAKARKIFERLLACRNRHGLLSEHIDPATGELWGNFPQTYSMVGLINSAARLSIRWEDAF